MQTQLPKYRSHKIVQAAPIIAVSPQHDYVVVENDTTRDGVRIPVDPKLFARGVPEAGAYFVVYDDGYQSWSPKAAFEGGYTRIDERAAQRPEPVPTIGRIVHLKLSQWHVDAIRNARKEAGGYQGNDVEVGEIVPAIVVKSWSPTCVNLRVILDGKDMPWFTSVVKGDDAGTWHWPPRV